MDKKAVMNVILTGVGGQGSILASHLLAESACIALLGALAKGFA